MTTQNAPIPGKQYALTGGFNDKCIMNGNSWAESEVKDSKKELKEEVEKTKAWFKKMDKIIKPKRELSSHAATAAAIRKELKEEFPKTKFRVRAESYAGGDSVHIGYEDGPTYESVDAISRKYQYGSFNGMEDIYEHSNSRDDIPQVKYVLVQRDMSDKVKESLGILPNMNWDEEMELRKEFGKINY